MITSHCSGGDSPFDSEQQKCSAALKEIKLDNKTSLLLDLASLSASVSQHFSASPGIFVVGWKGGRQNIKYSFFLLSSSFCWSSFIRSLPEHKPCYKHRDKKNCHDSHLLLLSVTLLNSNSVCVCVYFSSFTCTGSRKRKAGRSPVCTMTLFGSN